MMADTGMALLLLVAVLACAGRVGGWWPHPRRRPERIHPRDARTIDLFHLLNMELKAEKQRRVLETSELASRLWSAGLSNELAHHAAKTMLASQSNADADDEFGLAWLSPGVLLLADMRRNRR